MEKELQWKRKEYGPVLNIRKKEETVWLSWPSFEAFPNVIQGFSTRLGGVSEGHLYSMNLSFSRGDREEHVRENYRRIGAAIGFQPKDLVLSDQTHTSNVRIVTEADRGKGFVCPRDYTDVDGMVTNVPGLVLATFYADCVPLYFVDPVHQAIGLSHSGWRGTVSGIGAETVKKMQETYGTRPRDLYAAIGPSICQDCYEVSEDVIEQFEKNFEKKYYPELFYKKENGKYQLNLWRANEIVMLEAGVLPEHISVTDLCTCCNAQMLYSHRASAGKRGNLAAFLGLKKQ